jgi:hypothetical protein
MHSTHCVTSVGDLRRPDLRLLQVAGRLISSELLHGSRPQGRPPGRRCWWRGGCAIGTEITRWGRALGSRSPRPPFTLQSRFKWRSPCATSTTVLSGHLHAEGQHVVLGQLDGGGKKQLGSVHGRQVVDLEDQALAILELGQPRWPRPAGGEAGRCRQVRPGPASCRLAQTAGPCVWLLVGRGLGAVGSPRLPR